MIGTLVSYQALREYFGEEAIVPVYLEVEDGLRLARALERERQTGEAEICGDVPPFSCGRGGLFGRKSYQKRDYRAVWQ